MEGVLAGVQVGAGVQVEAGLQVAAGDHVGEEVEAGVEAGVHVDGGVHVAAGVDVGEGVEVGLGSWGRWWCIMAGPGAGADAGPYEKETGHEQMHCSQTQMCQGLDMQNADASCAIPHAKHVHHVSCHLQIVTTAVLIHARANAKRSLHASQCCCKYVSACMIMHQRSHKDLTFSKASYWVGTGFGAQPDPELDESASAPESMAPAMSSGMMLGSIMGAGAGAPEGPLA